MITARRAALIKVSKVREQIVQKAPAGLLGNVFRSAMHLFLVQVRAQRAAPDIDELQIKYGKAFTKYEMLGSKLRL